MCASGMGPTRIATELKKRRILKPSEYRHRCEGVYGTYTDSSDPYGWSDTTIEKMLSNEVYLGHTVNFRTEIISFKDKRERARPKEEQIRIENTHEAIIDQGTWEIVQKVREGKRRRNSMGEINKYSGLLYCADCGNKLSFSRGTTISPDRFNFFCSRYRKHMGEDLCSPHSIREVVLDDIVLEEINRTLYFSRTRTKEFAEYISKKSSAETGRELSRKTAELSGSVKRLGELKSLFKRLYEDNVLGRISDEQFRVLSADYTDEQKAIEVRIPELEKEISALKENVTNVQRFFDAAKKYTCISELTPEILRTFISKIVIHEKERKHCKYSPQQVDIYFRFIGDVSGLGEADSRRTDTETEVSDGKAGDSANNPKQKQGKDKH